MRYLNNYNDFKVNEEIKLKNAIIGGALAAGLVGCNTNSSTSNNQNDPRIEQTQGVSSQDLELSNSFTMDQALLSIGTDMEISTGGKVEERTLSWGKKFEYFDANGNLKATAKEEVFSLGVVINISDENGNKIGSVEQEILESMFSAYSIYSIKDASGRVVAESDKLDFLTTTVEIEDNEGGSISMSKKYFSIGASWDVNINTTIDKRLLIFIPSFVTSAQTKKSEE